MLDLFCGAGGCTKGYQRAGFYVVGVDLVRQPDYCGDEFVQADALQFLAQPSVRLGQDFDAIHSSPPCKARTVARHGGRRQTPLFDPHVDLVPDTLCSLAPLRVPWVVENVPGVPLDAEHVVTLCGSMFGLCVRRHRLFASSFEVEQPSCRHAEQGPVVGVYGAGGADSNRAARGGGGGVKVVGAEAADALGIDWTTNQRRLSQAIPPAYTEWIGGHLLAAVSATPNPRPTP